MITERLNVECFSLVDFLNNLSKGFLLPLFSGYLTDKECHQYQDIDNEIKRMFDGLLREGHFGQILISNIVNDANIYEITTLIILLKILHKKGLFGYNFKDLNNLLADEFKFSDFKNIDKYLNGNNVKFDDEYFKKMVDALLKKVEDNKDEILNIPFEKITFKLRISNKLMYSNSDMHSTLKRFSLKEYLEFLSKENVCVPDSPTLFSFNICREPPYLYYVEYENYIEELFDSLLTKGNLGTLLLMNDVDDNNYIVIDGWNRTTTLIILLKILRKKGFFNYYKLNDLSIYMGDTEELNDFTYVYNYINGEDVEFYNENFKKVTDILLRKVEENKDKLQDISFNKCTFDVEIRDYNDLEDDAACLKVDLSHKNYDIAIMQLVGEVEDN